jgi:hypothetical protein
MSQDQKNLKYFCFASILLGAALAVYGLVAWLGMGKLDFLNGFVTVFGGCLFIYNGFIGAQRANTLSGIDKFAQEAYGQPVFPVFMIIDYFLHGLDFMPQLIIAVVGIVFGVVFAFYVYSFQKKLAQQ